MTPTIAPTAAPGGALVATRQAYGEALLKVGNERQDVIVLDADLSGSTKTKAFGQAHPERFFNMGVAEANMIGTAAGLASRGKTVFASSFAMFAAGKAWEQVRQSVCVPNLSVKICATHAGLTVGEDGKSHQMLEDIALMRVLPHMRVIVPADATEARQVIAVVAETPGPFYVRLSRASTPVILGDDYQFVLGRAATLRDGADLAIIAAGVEVAEALTAAATLAEEGIQARVINMATIDPIDREAIRDAAADCGAILTAEEHQIHGGLGEAVASVVTSLNRPVPVEMVGMRGEFGQSGTAADLLGHYGLDAAGIVKSAKSLLSRKA